MLEWLTEVAAEMVALPPSPTKYDRCLNIARSHHGAHAEADGTQVSLGPHSSLTQNDRCPAPATVPTSMPMAPRSLWGRVPHSHTAIGAFAWPAPATVPTPRPTAPRSRPGLSESASAPASIARCRHGTHAEADGTKVASSLFRPNAP